MTTHLAARIALDALESAFPGEDSETFVAAFVSYLAAPNDDAAAVRALVEDGTLPELEAAAVIARHGHLFTQAVTALAAESARTGLSVEQLMQAHVVRHRRAAALAKAKAAFIADAIALVAQQHPGGAVPIEELVLRISEPEFAALGAAHGLALNEQGEVVGADGESDDSLGT